MFNNNFWYYICKDNNPDFTIAAFMADWDALKFYNVQNLKALGYVIYTSEGGKCDPNAKETPQPLQRSDTTPS